MNETEIYILCSNGVVSRTVAAERVLKKSRGGNGQN